MSELRIEYLNVDNLTPYEKNARKHSEKDVDAIVASIREFGFNDPIGIWGERNLIVEGHGRLLAAQKLGIMEVPCIRLDELSDEQRRAYALVHNKTAELSSWDIQLLDNELEGLFDFDAEAYGFQRLELEEFFEDESPSQKPQENCGDGREKFVVECENFEKQNILLAFLEDNGFKYTKL